MNRDDVIRMAAEAQPYQPADEYRLLPFIERFAALVAAAEREACAKVCEHKAAEWAEGETSGRWQSDCAAAIRARGQA